MTLRHTARSLVLLSLLASTALTGCMRDDEPVGPPFWLVQTAESASRRYVIKTIDEANTTQAVLRRRGSTWLLADERGNRLAKASVRRASEQVVLRDAAGNIVGHTTMTNRGIEVLIDEKVVTTLTFDAGRKRLVLSQDGVELREFVRNGTTLESRPLGIEGAVAVQIDIEPETERLLYDTHDKGTSFVIEHRARISRLGFALLMTAEIPPEHRLGLAAHADVLGEGLEPPES